MVHDEAETRALQEQLPKLAALGVNTLVIELNYSFAYDSHPELRARRAVPKAAAHELAQACRRHGIRPIPQFNCLGHQSWSKTTFPLLEKYPQFDETPGQFPHNEGIYCRSWCPLHPQVNRVVFALLDELIETFKADAFHVGMDEVFLIGSDYCPRCRGRDPAELFARAVLDLHAHLVGEKGVEMLMWGDRLLDARTTGYGRWEASANGTHPAIDRVPKDIVLCDWHYQRRDTYPSIPLFLEKGFRVWPAGWKDVAATEALIRDARRHRKPKLLGHLCTTWGAVQPSELAQWPPILAALKLWADGR